MNNNNATDVLSTLLEREEALRDQALSALQSAQTQAATASAQAQQLIAYRVEYQQRWRAQFKSASGGTVEILHCYQSFVSRLDLAIAQQERAAQLSVSQEDRARAAWQAQELRVLSVRKLIERRLAEGRRASERLEQKQTDEAAMRASWQRASVSHLMPMHS